MRVLGSVRTDSLLVACLATTAVSIATDSSEINNTRKINVAVYMFEFLFCAFLFDLKLLKGDECLKIVTFLQKVSEIDKKNVFLQK